MRTTHLRGARTHTLKGVDLDIEPGTFVVVAGPSGAGKSSLAFDTLHAEGQRRYVESFSPYARQFLERAARPDVDLLDPVPVGIAVDRQAPVRTSRSTVGTMTEITEHMKSLFAYAAELECPGCGATIQRDDPHAAARVVLERRPDEKLVVTYPIGVADTAAYLGVRETLLASGYRRLRTAGGEVRDLDDIAPSEVLGAESSDGDGSGEGDTETDIDVVADRVVARERDRPRLVEAIAVAMRRGAGRAAVWGPDGGPERFSRGLRCDACDLEFSPATPALFSFNSPVGACDTCRGFGRTIGVDYAKVFPDHSLSLKKGAVKAFSGKKATWERRSMMRHAKAAGIPTTEPVSSFTQAQWDWLIEGDAQGHPEGWMGVAAWFRWMESRAYKMHVRVFLSRYRSYETCAACGGGRLTPEALVWRMDGLTLPEFYALPVHEALARLSAKHATFAPDRAARVLHDEATRRLQTLVDVGLGYLSLDRQTRTLSGGETQRVSLTGALGAALNGAMFVLDEPTVGLHPRDVQQLSQVLRRLTDGDNIALVVEHDPIVIRSADRVIELGPGAGAAGGEVVFDGPPSKLSRAATATGKALRTRAPVQPPRAPSKAGHVRLRGARGHNLKGVDLDLQMGAVTCVTGVSGSGKSSLVLGTLGRGAQKALGLRVEEPPLPHDSLDGVDVFTGVDIVDQAPLGRTPRASPATYVKAWDVFRARLSQTDLARARDYSPGFFSINVAGGRCETCNGQGAETVEMQFLADVTFACADCRGLRFRGPVLDVRLRGHNVADLLAMSAQDAAAAFHDDARVQKALAPLLDVGLGYITLGQPLNTVSGGEAQRLKLALALTAKKPGRLVILDEPSAGLHAADLDSVLACVSRLRARGDTVVMVDHDMHVVASADHIVELGPGAGTLGGEIVASGTASELAALDIPSAPFLRDVLGIEVLAAPKRARKKKRGDKAAPMQIRGAREHNLRDVDVDIPREKLVVVTGPSGSGKSTLAFDVLFGEGQRRYLETLSPYARRYMPQLPRAAVDRVVGVPPSVSLEQQRTRGGGTSTVATLTEVGHYLRVVWSAAGTQRCPDCDVPIQARTPSQLLDDVRHFGGEGGARGRKGKTATVEVLAPVVQARKGHHRELLGRMRALGHREAIIDGERTELVEALALDRHKEHDVDVVLAKLPVHDEAGLRAVIGDALSLGDGVAKALAGGREVLLSSERTCPKCRRGFPPLDPRFFSPNTRQGQCARCEGRGEIITKKGRGRRKTETRRHCETCDGSRLSDVARAVTLGGRPITDVLGVSVTAAEKVLGALELDARARHIAELPIQEARRRLRFATDVGLGYLGLDRPADTLSGGELQRVRLSSQLGSGLTGALYVLDEPTIGLHPRDTGKLLAALRTLVDSGSSVVVVEHDADTIRAADHIIDIGPSGGVGGGRVVEQGTPAELLDAGSTEGASATAQMLAKPPKRARRRPVKGAPWFTLSGATGHNLRDVTLKLPVGRMVAVTGVSGSGKSTLVREVMLPAVRDALGLVNDTPPLNASGLSLDGLDGINRAVEVDQSPIGRTPRSVPATYVGVWDHVRKLLAGTPEARAAGFTPSRFSFNTKDGRCPGCDGNGASLVEMNFLPDVLVPCDVCHGMRFDPATLEVRWRGLHAGALLELDVATAVSTFASVPKVRRPLELLDALGLGYLKLGQASNTLSGGEAQRVKLAAELSSGASAGPTLYVLDEPTTGLHRSDVERLAAVLQRFVDRGDTVLFIEHHPDLILQADWVVDLGPEGGEGGGRIVAQGTPETIMTRKRSHTGKALRAELQ